MPSLKTKKKRSSTHSPASRLDLLRKKLELEQDLLNARDSGKKRASIEKEIEENESQEEKIMDAIPDPDPEETVEKVADLIQESKQSEKQTEPAPILSPKQKKNIGIAIKSYQQLFEKVRKEVAKIVIGQKPVVDGMFRALIADGHVLVEGVPGIAKTTLIRTLAQTTQCSFSRIQFTPDLLPTDIVGISTYQEGRGFYTLKGPIFNNFILADEINRAPPKVQSALLESMAEKQATIAKESFPVPLPFFTMATQNPLENVGTYALPEAQIDRFLFKLFMGYPTVDEEKDILRTNISEKAFQDYDVKPTLSPDLILDIQAIAKKIFVHKKVEKYIVQLIDATRNPKKYNVTHGKYLEYGSSPRGSIGLFKAARAEALLNGQTYVTPHHVKSVAHDILRHRIILSYEGQAEGLKTDEVVTEILKKVPIP